MPGTVLTSLVAACRFRLPNPLPRNGRAFLKFRGINYLADAYLNASPVATQLAGMFLRHRVDITDRVSSDQENALADRNAGLWDIVEVAVTGPVVIEFDPQIVTSINWPKNWLTDPAQQACQADVQAQVDISNTSAESVSVEVQFEVGGAQSSSKVELAPQESRTLGLSVSVPEPQLWWTYGQHTKAQGTQPLYPAVVRVLAGGEASDLYEREIGLREIKSGKDPATQGRYFEVNGERVFIRGGAWTFPDAMLRHSARPGPPAPVRQSEHDSHVGGRHHRAARILCCLRSIRNSGVAGTPALADCLLDKTFPGQAPTDAVRMLRNHACLDVPSGPPPVIDRALRLLIEGSTTTVPPTPGLDPKTPYIKYSTDDSAGLGPGDGDYGILEPKLFFQGAMPIRSIPSMAPWASRWWRACVASCPSRISPISTASWSSRTLLPRSIAPASLSALFQRSVDHPRPAFDLWSAHQHRRILRAGPGGPASHDPSPMDRLARHYIQSVQGSGLGLMSSL